MSVRLAKVNLSAKDNGITHMCYAVMSFYWYVSQKHIFKNMKSLLAKNISKNRQIIIYTDSFLAITSISQSPPFGRARTATQERAGKLLKYSE